MSLSSITCDSLIHYLFVRKNCFSLTMSNEWLQRRMESLAARRKISANCGKSSDFKRFSYRGPAWQMAGLRFPDAPRCGGRCACFWRSNTRRRCVMQRRRGRPIDAGVVGDENAGPHIAGVVIDDPHFAITEPREGKQYSINQWLLHFLALFQHSLCP